MDCRHALKVRELALDRLAGSPSTEADETFLVSHLASCAPCCAEVDGMSAVWARLGEDDGADLAVSPAFAARTNAALAAGMRGASNVRPFRLRGTESPLLKVAAVLMAGVAG